MRIPIQGMGVINHGTGLVQTTKGSGSKSNIGRAAAKRIRGCRALGSRDSGASMKKGPNGEIMICSALQRRLRVFQTLNPKPV